MYIYVCTYVVICKHLIDMICELVVYTYLYVYVLHI